MPAAAAGGDVEALAAALPGRSGVIVAGGGIDDPRAVHALADRLGWPVLADPRSGCRLPREATIAHADALLRVESFATNAAPEVVLRIGDLPASKVLAEWLGRIDAWQVGLDRYGRIHDPMGTLHALLAVDPAVLCAAVAGEVDRADGAATAATVRAAYERWVHADAEAAAAIGQVLATHPEPTEPAIARDVLAAVPDGGSLVVSSSMPVRDVEWYGAPRNGVAVLANRGANGIDGVTSTALGVAVATGRPTALLIGDVAFLHDSNGLLGAAKRPADLCVVVVDNDGGGIFSFLPQAGALPTERFEQLFGTPHGVDVAALAAAHGIAATTVTTQADVTPAVATALATGGVRLVVVRTDRSANVAVHRELHDAVAAAVRG